MTKTGWDEASWAVDTGDSTPIYCQTQGGQTWAIRALIAAGPEGLRPIDTGNGRWAKMVEELRAKGVAIADLPDLEGRSSGFVLAGKIARPPSDETGKLSR